MSSNSLTNGDWVRTDAGDTGEVVLISRESAFVELQGRDEASTLVGYLISQLTKIDPPSPSDNSPTAR